jgi:tetratricopeptide (TPR) repeat protein
MLEQAEIERAKCKPTESLQAYDFYLRGLADFYRERRDANCEALRQFYKAIELDSDFASAYGMAARCYLQRQNDGWMMHQSQERAEAARLAWRAAELGKNDAFVLALSSYALTHVLLDLEAGRALVDRALELNPNLALAWACSGWVRLWLGEPEIAIEHSARAMRLSPVDLRRYTMEAATATAHFTAGRYDLAVIWAEKALLQQSHYQPPIRVLAASHALAGRLDQARTAMARMRQLNPKMRIADLVGLWPFRRPDDFARYAEGLRLAGLPE